MRDTIQLSRSTSHLQPADVATRMGAVITKLQSALNLNTSWDDATSTVVFQSVAGFARGVEGKLHIGAGELTLYIKLPLLLQPQADFVEEQISQTFDEALK